MRGETASKYNELAAARSSLNFLQNRLQNLERQYDRLWNLEVNIHGKEVREQEAALEKAKALERAARLDYDRSPKFIRRRGGAKTASGSAKSSLGGG